MILLAVYLAFGALFHLKRKGKPPRFLGAPEGPDYSESPVETQQLMSHEAWHDTKAIPLGGDCYWCKRLTEKSQAAQRWLEHGRTRTP